MKEQSKNKSPKTSSLLHTLTSQEVGTGLAKREVSPESFALCVRQLLQNWRQGTVGCKTRGEVNYSNKKLWKQKGTGRARSGGSRSPIWVGGGIAFGPQPRVRKLKISKEMRSGVLNALFWDFLESGRIGVLDWTLEGQKPKTSLAYQALEQAQLSKKKVNIFLPMEDVLSYASFANIPNVRIVFFDEANAFDAAHTDQWIVLKKDLNAFKEMVARWS